MHWIYRTFFINKWIHWGVLTVYFLPRPATDLSLDPDSEVMMKVWKGRRRGGWKPRDRFQLTTRPCKVHLDPLNVEATSRHFRGGNHLCSSFCREKKNVSVSYLKLISQKISEWICFCFAFVILLRTRLNRYNKPPRWTQSTDKH